MIALFSVVGASAEYVAPYYPPNPTNTRAEPIGFVHSHTTVRGDQSQESVYMSPPMKLKTGEVVFTAPERTPLQMPTGRVAILGFEAEVIDDKNQSVPLNEVYNHHWLVFDGKGNAGVCDNYLQYKFGVGAESRNSPAHFADGYGLVLDGTEQWGANIHLLRTVDLEGGVEAVKNCIECRWAPQKGCSEKQSGEFACCGDGSFCKAKEQASPAKTYYLRYKVHWTNQIENIKPLDIYVLDASDCRIEYNIAAGTRKSEESVTELCWKNPKRQRLVYAVGHQHIGAINITLYTKKTPTSKVEPLCTSFPTYGTKDGEAGNERGYLVKMSDCNNLTSIVVEKGSETCVHSVYNVDPNDTRMEPNPGGAHGGVMSLFYLATYEEK